MIGRLHRAWKTGNPEPGLRFDRPLVLFQSDDWGRVGVRDREGWAELRANSVDLGENPYDSYSLETAGDLRALTAVLTKHCDSVGRHPSIGMNFIMANVDFPRCSDTSPQEIPLLPLTAGLPASWQRPSLIDAYRQGIRERLFHPALHGLTHFCVSAVERELAEDEHRELLQRLWRAGTPYIHWRMPWIGYEYWDPALPPDRRFIPLAQQRAAIQRAAEIFRAFFESTPFSACAPGYRANQDTKTAWFEAGVRAVQGGPGERIAPSLDSDGMLLTFRNVEMEPATANWSLETILGRANDCLDRGLPAIISMHSINLHSTIRDFRTATLTVLDDFLSALEKRWLGLLYVSDADLWHIATEGLLVDEAENIKVGVTVAESAR
ncbi:MAG: hypothetical protein WBS24_18475 [Terriglobales bacterium]